MPASTSNTTITTTTEEKVDTEFHNSDSSHNYGTATTVIRKTGATFTMAVSFGVETRLSGATVADMTEWCEDAIEHFTRVKEKLATISA